MPFLVSDTSNNKKVCMSLMPALRANNSSSGAVAVAATGAGRGVAAAQSHRQQKQQQPPQAAGAYSKQPRHRVVVPINTTLPGCVLDALQTLQVPRRDLSAATSGSNPDPSTPLPDPQSEPEYQKKCVRYDTEVKRHQLQMVEYNKTLATPFNHYCMVKCMLGEIQRYNLHPDSPGSLCQLVSMTRSSFGSDCPEESSSVSGEKKKSGDRPSPLKSALKSSRAKQQLSASDLNHPAAYLGSEKFLAECRRVLTHHFGTDDAKLIHANQELDEKTEAELVGRIITDDGYIKALKTTQQWQLFGSRLDLHDALPGSPRQAPPLLNCGLDAYTLTPQMSPSYAKAGETKRVKFL